jgi:hypothetical protein
MRNAGFVLLVALTLVLTANTFAAIADVISYQGRLLDSGGSPAADGTHQVTFELYDADAGGTVRWSSGLRTIATTDGFFMYPLGDSAAFPDNLFATYPELYLQITIQGDPPMTPRSRVSSGGYAYHALRAENVPGVTQTFDNGGTVYTGYLNQLDVDSINCPSDGYVMVSVTSGLSCNHTSGDDDALFVLVTDSTVTVESDQDGHAWALPPGMATGLYATPVNFHRVFTVSAGWNKYYAIAVHNAGGGTDNFSSNDNIMTLLFIPNSLGTVSAKSAGTKSSKFNGMPMK